MIARSDSTIPVPALELAQFFGEVGKLLAKSVSIQGSIDVTVMEQFFGEAAAVIELGESQRRETDRSQATRFNVFDLIEPDENKLSDIIADLLNPDGSHGQGKLFLSQLFRELAVEFSHDSAAPVKIVREAPTLGIQKFRRRIDILAETDVLLAIENKIDSPEQWEQIKDYLEYLRVHSRDWCNPALLVYLTPNGRTPLSVFGAEMADLHAKKRLVCWSYERDLRKWLERCLRECQADKICHLLRDLIKYIDSVLKRKAESPQWESPQ